MTSLIRMIIVIALASNWSQAMAIEEPEYAVIHATDDYEIRRYAPYIVAEVDVPGGFGEAGNTAFRQLAGYIFGDNEPQEKMAMTAPVESREAQRGERMKMTAPVLSESRADQGDVYTYAFVMERKYTLDTLPKPLNSDIRIVQRPSRIVAAHRYSGRWTEDNYREHEKRLLDALAADGVEIVGKPLLARYDAPFTPWFLRRNEIQVEVAWASR